jgi:hypothetical protein
VAFTLLFQKAIIFVKQILTKETTGKYIGGVECTRETEVHQQNNRRWGEIMEKEKDKGPGQGPKKLQVLVTSNDGHVKHPFDITATAGEVRQFAYDRLVKQKEQTPFGQTWLELNGTRLDDGTLLSSLAEREQGGGPEADLTLSLVWTTGGGR